MYIKGKIKIKNKIIQKDWTNLHPFKKTAASDFYYLQLANKIIYTLENDKTAVVIAPYLLHNIALSVTAYFEDVISNFGLWQSFTGKHLKMYGKYLPFYELTDNYIPEEINLEDIQFLIWSIIQKDNNEDGGNDRLTNPENPVIEILAFHIIHILEKEYETAPANDSLQALINTKKFYDDFFFFRELLAWLFYDSYLMKPYTKEKLKKECHVSDYTAKNEIFKGKEDILKYTVRNTLVFTYACGPLSLTALEWLEAMITNEEIKASIREVQFRPLETYRFVEIREKNMIIKSETKKPTEYLLDLDSFQHPDNLSESNIITTALVYYNKIWNVNGMASLGMMDDNSKIKLKNTPVEETDISAENKKFGYDRFMEYNKNIPIRYFKNMQDIKTFLLNVFPDTDADAEFFPEEMKNNKHLVEFANPDTGLIMIADMAEGIKDKNNPYYNPKTAATIALGVICGGYSCPKEMIDYLVENNLLPDARMNSLKGEEHGRKLVQENMDFMIRFFQPEIMM